MYYIKELSRLSGVSVRTLQHYDQIGLLSPRRAENGYRLYSEKDAAKLQNILFYRYLGFSLNEIKELLTKDSEDILLHLSKQLKLLKEEQDHLLTLINTLEKTIAAEKGKIQMSTKEKFKGFTYPQSLNYKVEAIELYGVELIEQAEKKQKGKEQFVTEKFNRVFFAFAQNAADGMAVNAEENLDLAKELHQLLCDYAFDCPLEVFGKIGLGYVKNSEFKKNIDQFGIGTAQYVCDAIQSYVKGE